MSTITRSKDVQISESLTFSCEFNIAAVCHLALYRK